MQTIWKGTKAMFENDGSKMNIDVFWEEFSKEYGDEKLVDRPYFDEFYVNEFKQTKEVCFDNPYAKEIVEYPNGGKSYFYEVDENTVVIVDEGICNYDPKEGQFSYTLITDKQNYYVHRYKRVFFCRRI